MFKPRFTRPEAGNKFYIRKASGGYSTAIKGSPTDKDCDVLHNCVGYAAGRFHEIAGRPQFDLVDTVNAELMYSNAKAHGLTTGSTPQLGALIVWQKGATLSGSDGAGHVAVVEQFNADCSIVTSESGYNCKNAFWTTKRSKCTDGNWGGGAGYKFLGFVYQPEAVQPMRAIRKGDTGADVELMQARLHALGYLRKNEIDGDFGRITLGAVCAFQLENGLEVDGVCGPKTKAKLTL